MICYSMVLKFINLLKNGKANLLLNKFVYDEEELLFDLQDITENFNNIHSLIIIYNNWAVLLILKTLTFLHWKTNCFQKFKLSITYKNI